ncbi:MAG TPA: DUF1737 domain-containing protein [Verrucomicrobiae bacterium]|nr:DUF1737 domain-containing protein [Verrucomicrobiae bacterium]
MITRYEVITATRVGELQDRVQERIKGGWQPLGGIAMLHEEDAVDQKPHIVFAQSIVASPAVHKGASRSRKTS